MSMDNIRTDGAVPWFGARKFAQGLLTRLAVLQEERKTLEEQLRKIGGMPLLERAAELSRLEAQIAELSGYLLSERTKVRDELEAAHARLQLIGAEIVATEDLALLQGSGVYEYSHPLSDAVAYQERLRAVQEQIKGANRKDGGAVSAATGWSVNGSEAQGRTMLRDYCKLMLRAFNAEADTLVRGLKPYKVDAAKERLEKVAQTIERLGKTMSIRISDNYLRLRISELELTGDFLQKQAEEKEAERVERERIREERKVHKELEKERERLAKERQHYLNALEALAANGDEAGLARVRDQLADVDRAIEQVDYRTANIRAGYVYVISNVGAFGDSLVKVGMTRRLDPLDRIRELSDASVPFNFDVHAVFFSTDAVGIESAMHERLGSKRVNRVNLRREFFNATALEAKLLLTELAGELLTFHDIAEALEYRQSVKLIDEELLVAVS